jgi:hypothetical protein
MILIKKLCASSITHTHTHEMHQGSGSNSRFKIHFQQQVDNVFSQAVRLLGYIRTVTFSFPSLHCLLKLYYTPVRPKLESLSVAWKCIISSVTCNLERFQRQFVSLHHHHFFIHLDHSYGNVLNYWKFHILTARRLYIDVLFFFF